MPAWVLGRDPSAQILCASYAQGLSEKMARDMRTLMNNPWYQSIFGTRLVSRRARLRELAPLCSVPRPQPALQRQWVQPASALASAPRLAAWRRPAASAAAAVRRPWGAALQGAPAAEPGPPPLVPVAAPPATRRVPSPVGGAAGGPAPRQEAAARRPAAVAVASHRRPPPLPPVERGSSPPHPLAGRLPATPTSPS